MELEALKDSAEAIIKLGATLVLMSPTTIAHNQAIAHEKKLACDILSDPGNQVAARYGLKYAFPDDLKALYQQFDINLEKYNPVDPWTLPLPARMIIDSDGVIRYAAVNTDYTVRPDPQETIAALQQIV